MRLPGREVLRLRLAADPRHTEWLGEQLGRHLHPGDVLALVGDLGAGKTTLTRGLARGLGVDDPDAVASPTYLLVVEHPGPIVLRHADAYLPAKLAAFLGDGGLDYLFDGRSVTVLEWADRVAALVPPAALWLELSMLPAGGRLAVFCCRSPADHPWLAGMAGLGDNGPRE